jgi:DNA-binding MarR family transcriptional regulator
MVVNLSRKYAPMLKKVQEELLLPRTELGILQTLHSEDKPKRPAFVAAELDCSYQLVGKRAVRLEERGLVKRLRDEHDHRILEITALAESNYFSSAEAQQLDVDEGGEKRIWRRGQTIEGAVPISRCRGRREADCRFSQI